MNINTLFQGKRLLGYLFFLILAIATVDFGTASQAAELQVIHAEQPWIARNLAPINPLPETNRLNLSIALPLRNQAALSNLLEQIYDPASPNYHQYLTPAEFTAKFGPSQSDYQAVIDFARQNGFQVTATHSNRLLVDVNGTVPVIENALHVKMHTYRHPTENRIFYAPDSQPTVDLGVPVLRINGLDNYSLPHPLLTTHAPANGQNAAFNAGSGLDGSYLGNDFRAAYVPSTTLTGSGQRVGLLEFDGYTSNDITAYEQEAGLPAVVLTNELIDGYSGQAIEGGDAEVSLDIEMAISMAPGLSQVIVYEAPNDENSGAWHDMLNQMATDDTAKQLSCSWYIPGGISDPVADGIWQEMAAQGQTFLAASGDSDAYTGLIPFPGDSPYITIVGGTELSTTGPGGSWTSETVWNEGGGGSSGGISTQYPIPSWQTNVSMAANQGSTTMRNIPDVALTADNVDVRVEGANTIGAGTSCAAPLWAGFIALVNQEATAGGHSAVGFLNPLVYAIGAKAAYSTDFHDITTGNNESESSPTMFSAVAGYDLCTGWGTPAGQKLIDALANPEPLVITPSTGFSSIGGIHGPFSITSQAFTLTNVGTSSLNWSLANTSSWLNVSSTGGTLAAAGPAASVIVSLNTVASNLPVGLYNATLAFTNLSDNFGQHLQFSLDIISPPVITLQPTNQAVLDGENVTFSAQTSGGVPQYFQWQFDGTNLTDVGDILGSSTTNLIINAVSVANVGTYTLIVSNAAGIVVSSNAMLTLIPSAPIIITQPTNESIGQGGTAQFVIVAVGTKPISYQWTFDSTNIAGATSSILTVPDVQPADAGNYTVVVTNIYGSTNSQVATLAIAPCDPVPSGLVGWWKGDGNTLDSSGYNNAGTNVNEGYTNGIVGEAFEMDPENWPYGTYNAIDLADEPQYILTNQFTIEGWIRPRGDSYTVFQRTQGGDYAAYDLCMLGNTNLSFYITDDSNTRCLIYAPLVYNVWWHIAATYSNGVMILYTNGVMAAETNTTLVPMGAFNPNNSPGVAIGNNNAGAGNFPFIGDIDEISLYNRALSQSQIQAIYNAGSEGKCYNPTAPVIIIQPTNQTVFAGQSATFSVTAIGTGPLYYQWTYDTTNIIGATNAIFTLPNVQAANAGNYAVIVSNELQSVLSSNAVLTVNAVTCVPPPSGLVGWWKGDGNTLDSSGYNNTGTNVNEGYTNGIVGEAFEMDPENWPNGTYNAIDIADEPQYYMTNTFTIEGWIRPREASYTVFQRSAQNGNYAAYDLCMLGNNVLSFYIANYSNDRVLISAPLVYNVWWHIAATYSNGMMILYTNGVVAAQTTTTVVPMGAFAANLYPGMAIGNNNAGAGNFPFIGDIDELSLYNRALSQSQIQAIYNAGSGGKCINLMPPDITTQPESQTVNVGQSATFSVTATGTGPLYYQWTFNTNNIIGATNATLTLSDVQFTNAGNYAVIVSNELESVLSSNAVLTVNPLPSCDPAPSGLVGWWKGDGNAWDSSGYQNNGTAVNEGYTNGIVGEAFEMDPENWPNGTYNAVDIPDAPQYILTNAFTIEGWIRPREASYTVFQRSAQNGNYAAYDLCMLDDNVLSFYITDYSNDRALISTPLAYNVWWHIAATYTNGTITLYTNGVVATQMATTVIPMGAFNTNESPGVAIGNNNPGTGNFPFIGDVDELSLYNRALSQSEIQAIYNAGSGGKCLNLTQPVIISQPTNQTVNIAQSVSFSVSVLSTTPVSYQWQFDGTNILNATNTTLLLANVQLNNAGVYDVTVTNMIGGVISSNAVLTVSPLTHFAWAPIPSPRFLSVPFPVTIVAQNATNGTVLTYNNSVMLYTTNTIPLSPAFSGNFIQGVWTGTVVVAQTGTNVVLEADDGQGHTGLSNPLNILALPNLSLQAVGPILLLDWPMDYNSFELEESSNLYPANWLPVPVNPLQIGNQYIVPLEMAGTNGFYRLQFQGP